MLHLPDPLVYVPRTRLWSRLRPHCNLKPPLSWLTAKLRPALPPSPPNISPSPCTQHPAPSLYLLHPLSLRLQGRHPALWPPYNPLIRRLLPRRQALSPHSRYDCPLAFPRINPALLRLLSLLLSFLHLPRSWLKHACGAPCVGSADKTPRLRPHRPPHHTWTTWISLRAPRSNHLGGH